MRTILKLHGSTTTIGDGIVQSHLLAQNHMLQWILMATHEAKVICSYTQIITDTDMCTSQAPNQRFFYALPKWWDMP